MPGRIGCINSTSARISAAALRVQAPRGQLTLTNKYAEILEPNGSLYTENPERSGDGLLHPQVETGWKSYELRFTFHGFLPHLDRRLGQ